jgi:hypothetical protein
MDEIEQRLKSSRLAAPSPQLDDRMNAAFLAAGNIDTKSRSPGVVWWLATVAVAGAIAALFFVSPHRLATEPKTIVYEAEAQGRMRQMLLGPAAAQTVSPAFVFRVNTP